MKTFVSIILSVCLTGITRAAPPDEDSRQLVQMPAMMQQHMLANMRDHLTAINEILTSMANAQPETAAGIAESRLGMSSLARHGAAHMAAVMPEGMREAGTRMHRAASRFALKAEAGETDAAWRALTEVTSACVACHANYRVR